MPQAVRRRQQPPEAARDRQEPPGCAQILVNFGPETSPRFGAVWWPVKGPPDAPLVKKNRLQGRFPGPTQGLEIDPRVRLSWRPNKRLFRAIWECPKNVPECSFSPEGRMRNGWSPKPRAPKSPRGPQEAPGGANNQTIHPTQANKLKQTLMQFVTPSFKQFVTPFEQLSPHS